MSKVSTAFKIIKIIKNWPIYFAGHLNIIKNKYIIYALRSGIKFKIRTGTIDQGIIKEICVDNIYTPKGYEIHSRDTIIDIGAHIGIFSIYAARYAQQGKVYSYEPVPENFRLLKDNIKQNAIRNIQYYKQAILNKNGKAKILLHSDLNVTGGHSFYNDGHRKKQVSVPVATLSSVIKKNHLTKIDFLKIDCEGGEYDIIFNCPKAFLKKVRIISMEYHNIDRARNSHALSAFLSKNGYSVRIVTNRSMGKPEKQLGMLYAKRA